MRGHVDVLQALLEVGADPALTTRRGRTPAEAAAAVAEQQAGGGGGGSGGPSAEAQRAVQALLHNARLAPPAPPAPVVAAASRWQLLVDIHPPRLPPGCPLPLE